MLTHSELESRPPLELYLEAQHALSEGHALYAMGHLSLAQRVALFEKEAIIGALRSTSGDVQQSCAKLGTPRKTLYDKIARYRIDLQDIRTQARP